MEGGLGPVRLHRAVPRCCRARLAPAHSALARRVALPALIGASTSYVTFVLLRGAAPLIPVSGIASGVLFLGETLAPLQIAGAALVFTGLVVNTYALSIRAWIAQWRQ